MFKDAQPYTEFIRDPYFQGLDIVPKSHSGQITSIKADRVFVSLTKHVLSGSILG